MGAILPIRGHLAIPGDIYFTDIWLGESRDANNAYPAPNISSAKNGKHCLSKLGDMGLDKKADISLFTK